MQTKLGLACWIGSLMMSSTALVVVGCGDDAKQTSDGAGAGGAAGGVDASGKGGSDAAADGGTAPSDGGTSSTGAKPNVDPGGPGGPGDPNGPDQPGAGGEDGGADSPDFDGVNLEDVSESAPTGCVGGFDPELGSLALAVGGDAPVVRLSVHEGVIRANGVDCESEAGEPARAADVLSVEIGGSDGDDALYLDLSDEAFSGAFAAEGRVSISLGAGADRVTVLGTLGEDVFQLGTDGEALLIDVTGDDRPDVSIAGTPTVVLSTGGEEDSVRADGEALGVAPAAISLQIYGGGNRDSLVGGAASDLLFGGIGNDWFDAGAAPAGGDAFDGGEGVDTIDFSARTAPLSVTLGAGKNDGEAGEEADVDGTVEIVYGGQAVNELTGGDADNVLWGGPEDDVLAGGKGNDWLNGGPGDDRLSGDEGSDTLYGDEGDDVLLGGAGDDNLDDDNQGKNTLDGGPGDGDICPLNVKSTNCEL